jgi:hypothetical protein
MRQITVTWGKFKLELPAELVLLLLFKWAFLVAHFVSS